MASNNDSSNLDHFASLLQLPRNCNNLCLLVVADLDLPSASALAEDALCHLPDGGTLIDCVCACGPFVDQFTDLQPYMTSPSKIVQPSPELTHALEGLVTGCLSQLENIVCRVVWVPSVKQDPTSLFLRQSSKISRQTTQQRLTPNSRNVHQECLPLAPGLSCYGLSGSSSIGFNGRGRKKKGGEKDYLEKKSDHDCDSDDEDIAMLLSKLLALETVPVEKDATEHSPWEKFSMTSAIVLTTGISSATLVKQEMDNLLLHICASPLTEPSYSNGVLIPGSLKNRGEYCLVHLQIMSTSPSSYAW
eukprot:CAMPEP_0194173076 /NCGR_PEP_ID=MMETSP0154-20130528/7458_1 /TAXON_ID=1049557 /ORGANISM="Thalassiothrix antarctica, Strain L6-D1" /LENGTH=303 /DNA_ID=CAMNT_0038885995 /DNA_START=55 /DNA_END=963 /DNA_ORIENTATION=+